MTSVLTDKLSSVVDILAMAGPAFKNNVRTLITGDPSRTQAIDTSDAGVQTLTKAYPNLATVILHGIRNLKTQVLPALLSSCAVIQAITLSTAKDVVPDAAIITILIRWESDNHPAPSFQYLDLRGVYADGDFLFLLERITRRRSQLEIVHEYSNKAAVLREGKTTPLSTTQIKVLATNSEDNLDNEDRLETQPDSRRGARPRGRIV